jgi:hypothetical protein
MSAASQPDAAVATGADEVADGGVVDEGVELSLQAEASRLRAKATTNEGRAAIMAKGSGSWGWESMPGSIPAFFSAADITGADTVAKRRSSLQLHTIVFSAPRLFCQALVVI